jgi:integrase
MALNLISTSALRALKPGATTYNNKKRLDDGGGLYLLLGVKGNGRAWRFDYTIAGKRKTISLGTYPDTTLPLARAKAIAAREEIAAGIDPSATRKTSKAVQLIQIEIDKREESGLPAVDSFEFVAREWYEKQILPLSASHSGRTLAYLNNDLIPYLGKFPMQEIKAPALLECLRRIEARKNKQGHAITETANRVREQMGQLWRYAIATGRADRDIAADLRGALDAHVQKNFSHITDPKQLGQLLRDIDGYSGSPTVKAALRMLPIVFTRPGEFRAAKWADIDLEAKEWRYVATKTDTDHIVPLSDQAIAHLQSIYPLTGSGEFVFGVRAGARPLSENTINQALKALGYTSDIIHPHGFRHTAATMLAEMGWNTEAIDRQLAHKEQGVKGVYQKAKYLEERKKMMQAWADYTDGLRSGAQVIPFKAA